MLKNESIEKSWIPKRNTIIYRDLNLKKKSDFKDDVRMTDNDNKFLDIDTFIKLITATRVSNHFETYKTLFS